jgi:hypothetical protein
VTREKLRHGHFFGSSQDKDQRRGFFMTGEKGYRTIKALVIDFVHRCNGHVSFEALTEAVRRQFPTSKWKKSHWAWYRQQILHGRFRAMFSDDELTALAGARSTSSGSQASGPLVSYEGKPLIRGPVAKDPEVKRIGDAILDNVRLVISLAAGDDIDKQFKLNRWVFSRLLQDEIRVKRPIKRKLWDSAIRTRQVPACAACREKFESLKGVEIHRKDESKGYSEANCELLCRECHQELD